MRIEDFFRPIPSKTVDDVKRIVEAQTADETILLDVRQPDEYEKGHLPGALHIPLPHLIETIGTLKDVKPVVAYSLSGMRSASAVAVLLKSGFNEVFNMEGGMKAWDGLVATGRPAMGMAFCPEEMSFADIVRISIALEDGASRFYTEIARRADDREVVGLFATLAGAEEKHKASIRAFYLGLYEGTEGIPEKLDISGEDRDYMEGGVRVSEALSWIEGKGASEMVQLAMSVEVNAYDLYLLLLAQCMDDDSKELFSTIAEEELGHLHRLGEVLDRCLEKSG